MPLCDILARIDKKSKKEPEVQEIDKEKVKENLEYYRNIISYWRVYPDKFIDYLCSLNPENKFKFYFIQRMTLRIMLRYKTIYFVFSRGFSKSFIAVMALMIKAILYPGASIAAAADGKAQSAAIVGSKMEEICKLIPALGNEIIWDTRGQIATTSQTRDSVRYAFKNGSSLCNAAMAETTRGQRFQSLLVEESAKVDQEKLTEIIMPTLVVSRKIAGGLPDPNEVLNQSSMFVTSAGYKNTFAYDKLIDTLCRMVSDRDNNDGFILGGDWKIPVVEGLQPADFIKSQEMDNSMDEAGFRREYNSLWEGQVEGAFFNPTAFDTARVIEYPDNEYDKRSGDHGQYILGVDVGRKNDLTEVVVIKETPISKNSRETIKKVVNIFTIPSGHFEMQAIQIKEIFKKFHCSMCVLDANGLGIGLVDFMVRDQVNPKTGETLYNFGIVNDDDKIYKSFETDDTIKNALYLMKANNVINSALFAYCQILMKNGRLHFLLDDGIARNKLMGTANGKSMSASEREDYLRPYVETSILKSQMMNLISCNDGALIKLKQATRRIKKDKVSALLYGLFWCRYKEEKREKRSRRNLTDLILYTKHN